jgi:hypothetical protein
MLTATSFFGWFYGVEELRAKEFMGGSLSHQLKGNFALPGYLEGGVPSKGNSLTGGDVLAKPTGLLSRTLVHPMYKTPGRISRCCLSHTSSPICNVPFRRGIVTNTPPRRWSPVPFISSIRLVR